MTKKDVRDIWLINYEIDKFQLKNPVWNTQISALEEIWLEHYSNIIKLWVTFQPVTSSLFFRRLAGRKPSMKFSLPTATFDLKGSNTRAGSTGKRARKEMVQLSLLIVELIDWFLKLNLVSPKILPSDLSYANLSQFRLKTRWIQDRQLHFPTASRRLAEETQIPKYHPFQVYPLSISVAWQWVGKNCANFIGEILLLFSSLFCNWWCISFIGSSNGDLELCLYSTTG